MHGSTPPWGERPLPGGAKKVRTRRGKGKKIKERESSTQAVTKLVWGNTFP